MSTELKNPFFTIIIPTYNRKHVVGRAIQSVLNQEFKDWELIIVDDGSIDQTDAYISSHFEDNRIRYLYKIHEERSAARNYGIEQAKGKFICFLDSDDEYLPNFLQDNFDAIKLHPEFQIFRCGAKLVKCNVETILDSSGKTLINIEDLFYNMNGLPSYIFAISLFEENSFDQRFYIAEDFHLLARIAIENDIFQQNDIGVKYHYNPNSELLKNKSIDQIINRLECNKDLLYLPEFSKSKYSKWVLLKYFESYLMALVILVKTRNYTLFLWLFKNEYELLKSPVLFIKATIKFIR